jgi:L,D-transpeptidase ErfK/SrfK
MSSARQFLSLTGATILGMSLFFTSSAAWAEKFTDNFIGSMQTVSAKYEDTLVHLGREHGLGFVEMRAANPKVDPWLPGAGTNIVIPTMHLLPDAPRRGVVINLAEMRLYLYPSPNAKPETYAIGIGRDGLMTPVGTTTVVRKKEAPTWTPTARMREEDPTLPAFVPPGLDNPMGTHALYLGFPLIAIHGTNKPYGIGRRVSSGCIRMFPEDIDDIFRKVPVGSTVTVVDQPIKANWIGDEFYLEVHPTQQQATQMERDGVIPDYELTDRDLAYIMRVAGSASENLDWKKIRQVVKERRGYPIPIAKRAASTVSANSNVSENLPPS